MFTTTFNNISVILWRVIFQLYCDELYFSYTVASYISVILWRVIFQLYCGGLYFSYTVAGYISAILWRVISHVLFLIQYNTASSKPVNPSTLETFYHKVGYAVFFDNATIIVGPFNP